MDTLGSRQIQFMLHCFMLADAASGAERERLEYMAGTFERGALQIERSKRLIAESRDLLEKADRLVPPGSAT
jgi:hypothetical protein